MKKRRIRFWLISFVMLFAVSVIAPSAFLSYYNDDRPIMFLYNGPTPASSITVWLNGSKRDVPVGTSVDNKTKQLTLYERFDGEMYDITGSKFVKWIAMPMPAAGGIFPPSDFKSAKSENCAVTVSKGKVSAKSTGTAVVMALKSNKNGDLAGYEYCIVDVNVGPSKFAVLDEDKKPLKSLTIGVGETTDIYLSATANTPVHFSEIYRLEFEKNGFDFASFGNRGDSMTITQTMLESTPIPIRGRDMINGKPTKVTVLITALYSGRTAKFTFTIDNPVYDTTYSNIRLTMDYSRFDNTTRLVTADTINNMIISSAEYNRSPFSHRLPITDKPKVIVTDIEPTVENMTDSKGIFKLQGKTNSGLSAKLDSIGNLTLTLKKATATTPSTKTYVVVSFNDRIYNQRHLAGCLIFEVDINGVFIPLNDIY